MIRNKRKQESPPARTQEAYSARDVANTRSGDLSPGGGRGVAVLTGSVLPSSPHWGTHPVLIGGGGEYRHPVLIGDGGTLVKSIKMGWGTPVGEWIAKPLIGEYMWYP